MHLFLAGLFLLVLAWPVGGEKVPYRAVVMELVGQATVSHEGNRRPLELGDLLYLKDEVEIAAGAALTIFYPQSGEEEQWPGGLKFTVGELASEPRHPEVKIRNLKVDLPPGGGPPAGLKLRGKSSEPAAPQPAR